MSKNSFGALAAKWMELCGKQVSPKTLHAYKALWKEIFFPRLKYPIRDIRPADILAPMKELEKTGQDNSHMQEGLPAVQPGHAVCNRYGRP